ncbi:F0F1 ATP synthase subunit B' [Hyphobacterium sp.]|jgi:F-type H+-transporting ATPase subunit b|uniref:F0F1 ATP synthase subunit B family protein n=1 Tax=Hyphobacterium sp. TaxID=2004662 RepID=UPI003BA8434E
MTLISMMGLAVAAADEAYGEEAGAFPPFDPTYFASQVFWLVISFAALYFLMSRWILPRIGGVIEERRDRIADDLDVAQQIKSDAEETRAAYEKSLADARARAHALAAEAKAEVDREIAEETAEVDAEIAAKSEEAEKALAEARARALAEVRNIAASSAAEAANALAGLSVNEADAAKAIAAMDKD